MFLTYTVGPWLISAVQCCSDSWRQAEGSFISMLSWLLRKDKQEVRIAHQLSTIPPKSGMHSFSSCVMEQNQAYGHINLKGWESTIPGYVCRKNLEISSDYY